MPRCESLSTGIDRRRATTALFAIVVIWCYIQTVIRHVIKSSLIRARQTTVLLRTTVHLRSLSTNFFPMSHFIATAPLLRNYASSSSVFTLRLKSILLKSCVWSAAVRLPFTYWAAQNSYLSCVWGDIIMWRYHRIMDRLDRSAQLSLVTFAAVNHDRIPKYGPEELNICTIADRQADGHSCHN